ncbi:MAG TPA: bifunctional phosphopantothenoylcysteine decarboxylase/phosphopantothenate--cysteine ligase CoaBC [Burkholderiales bacterium]|nr:bifunctional phosphopantothenoylcysteine decarboxylase/phosphopantothenate--cysteine ligase CoaBC [Burkholderiales bacterium]
MSELANKRILLGMTGGIAAYKAAELSRLLIKDGADVQVVMTDAASHFITAATMQGLTGKPVFTDMWDNRVENGMPHIELSRDRDLVVIAPASADFIAKLVQGRADDLLSTLCLARECPMLVAPAMNRQMWENPATQRNVAQIRQDGVMVVGPGSGDQACGETGMGRMLEPEQILSEVVAWFQPKLLSGTRVLVTAGPTFEPIDAVRGISNPSSGRMGYAVARAAIESGAAVTLISGDTCLEPPRGAEVLRVTTAREMLDAVIARASLSDIVVSVAAVSDYQMANRQEHKIKKSGGGLTLELIPNPDILEAVMSRPNPPFCVGFAAESRDLDSNAEEKRRRKKLPLLAANLVQSALGAQDNELVLFDDGGRHPLPRSSKLDQARQLVRHIARLYKPARATSTAH